MNAGSGPWDYGLRAAGSIQVDIVASGLVGMAPAVIADIGALPFASESFAVIVCVGSVLNYDDPRVLIPELARALITGGTLILEYERVATRRRHASGHLLGESVAVAYKGIRHNITVFTDTFIDHILTENGFRVSFRSSFHVLSNAASSLLPASLAALALGWCDLLPGIQSLACFAGNSFLTAQRRRDHV